VYGFFGGGTVIKKALKIANKMASVGGIGGNPQQVCFSNSLRETQTYSVSTNRFLQPFYLNKSACVPVASSISKQSLSVIAFSFR
jgi:hypothetical protein